LTVLLGYMHGLRLSPWMTRREAAEYLRWKVAEVDGSLVPLASHPAQVKGKMRYLLMDVEGARQVRVLAGDVFSVLPLPSQVSLQPDREPALAQG
jgi:hypothetical protein